MGIERRRDRGSLKWGFRKYYRGRTWRRYLWDTEAEAKAAYARFLKEEFEPLKRIPKNALIKVVNDFIVYSAEQGRSKWRIDGISRSFDAIIIPHFGATKPITDIDEIDINKFVLAQKKRFQVRRYKTKHGHREVQTKQPIKNSTINHYVTDLRALFNYAVSLKQPLALINPVDMADLTPIKNRKFIKLPLDPKDFEVAAKSLPIADRIYFDHLRFTGARKDEGNRTEWEHLFLADVTNALAIIPGSKTDDSLEIVPLPQSHAENLLKWKVACPSDRWVFPSCSKRSKSYGKKTYHRNRMFRHIKKETGIKITPKDLRDYFCNEVAANTDDPVVLMTLMRHKSLQTTTKYTRRVLERMKSAVANLGSEKGSLSVAKSTANSLLEVLAEVRGMRATMEEIREKEMAVARVELATPRI